MDKEKSNELTRERMRRYRNKERNETGSVTKSVTDYPAVVLALADDDRRAKLEKICVSLKNHGVLEDVRYGYFGPTFYGISKTLGIT